MSSLTLFPESASEGAPTGRGILPYQDIRRLIAAGHLAAPEPITEEQLQPASIDLRLGPVAYQVRGSFLPGRTTRVETKLRDLVSDTLDLTASRVLQKECVYIIPLMEELVLPAGVSGRANPKSTLGRLDVFTRLITDYGSQFDVVPEGYKGRLFVEVAPRSFSVLVRAGTRLNQLRLSRGRSTGSDAMLSALNASQSLVFLEDDAPARPDIAGGLWISIDLKGAGPGGVVGYRALKGAPVIDLDMVDHYDPREFWEAIPKPAKARLVLQPREFYILGSREKIRVPPTAAAEMVSYDPSVGEYRIHYAGFFDPGFGYGDGEMAGTRAVLEVRSHEVPVVLEHGQRVGRLIYEQLLAVPDKLYGPAAGSSYYQQGIALSKQFRVTAVRRGTSPRPTKRT